MAGDAWHRDLLRGMAEPGSARPALLPAPLHETMLDYLRFRHVFRNAYSFDLQWEKMSALVLNVEATLLELERALDEFLTHAPRATDNR